jgi:serralysin
VVATDADVGQTVTYSITGGADSAKFSIVAATGVLTFATAPNFEVPTDGGTNNVYDLIVTATDDGSPVGSKIQTIAVTVTNVDDAPVITSSGSASFAENATGTVYTAAGSDPESAALSFTMGGTDAGRFDINATSGAVTFKVTPNFEAAGDSGADNVYDITVTASDGDLSSAAQAVAITVTNVNDAPVITSNGGGASAAINVAENTTAVTTVVATDADLPAQGITYSITGGADSAHFSVVAATGVLTFSSAPDFENKLDVGADNVYDLIVTVTDDGSPTGTKTQSIAVTVTNANEAPVITGNSVSILDGATTPSTTDHTDFGSAQVTGGTVVRTFTIANNGTVSLTLSGTPLVSVSGTHAADFTVTALPTSPVTASGSTTFQVTFDPSGTGTRTATLTLANDDSDEGTFDFAIQGTGVSPFTTWQTLNGATGTIAADHDNDGVPDGIEYFVGGPNGNTTGQTTLPSIINSSGTLSITWIKGTGYPGVYGSDYLIETTTTMTGTWTPETVGVNVTLTGNNVTYTFPAAAGNRRFVRLKVMAP